MEKNCVLWWAGFKDACSFYRVFLFCNRSRTVFVKTGQCFLLNGCIFLGSIGLLQKLVIPVLRWLLISKTDVLGNVDDDTGIGFLGTLPQVFVALCYILWLYPLYIISFVINCIWYNEIAQQACEMVEQSESSSVKEVKQQPRNPSTQTHKSPGWTVTKIDRILMGIGEQIYSIIMLTIFFIEVYASSFIPFFGKFLNFVMLCWLYAYYCFDYKWGFCRWSLEKRLLFFETNWAFFAGFGSPCVLATYFLSPLVSYGVMAVLFPLFVLVATASDPDKVVSKHLAGRSGERSELKRIPVFYIASTITLPFLGLLQKAPNSLHSRTKKYN